MTGIHYGGFWRRLFGYAVDKFILYCISLFLLLVAIAALALSGSSAHRLIAEGNLLQGIGPILLLYLGTLFVVDMLYFTWFHGSSGQTPGKMLLKLRVVPASGGEMTFGAAFLRWAGTYVSGLFLSLGYLWIAVDKRKQGWHDKIAATLVVRVPDDPLPDSSVLAVPPAGREPCPASGAPGNPVTEPGPAAPQPAVSAPAAGAAAPPKETEPSADRASGALRNIP